jgi:putative sterol carrier protein
MAHIFPSVEWLQAFQEKLNSDEKYARIAKNWEGDIMFKIEPEGPLKETMSFYLDLWHGKCRQAFIAEEDQKDLEPVYVFSAPYISFTRILKSELDPMQAMITRKLRVQGSMAYMMRNVPVVLDFVRCAQELEFEYPK